MWRVCARVTPADGLAFPVQPILKHTLKETGSVDRVDQESLKELMDMLQRTKDVSEAKDIRLAINECKAGRMREKKKQLGSRRVVGVTCASTRQDVLSNQKFAFAILDECSQSVPRSFSASRIARCCGLLLPAALP